MKNINRRSFFGSSMVLMGLYGLAVPDYFRSGRHKDESKTQQELVRLKGRPDSRIRHWDIITIGNLSRNRYWGESDERGIRKAICTSTLIRVDDHYVLVDPSLADAETQASELNRRTGLDPDDIDVVFITHQHGDHHAGLPNFTKAKWLAGADTAEGLNSRGTYLKPIEPAGSSIYNAIEVVPTPGHTTDHHSLRFDFKGLSVLIAGDAVATYDFWTERRMYYNAVDLEESAHTLKKIASLADIVVPGYDNYFFNLE